MKKVKEELKGCAWVNAETFIHRNQSIGEVKVGKARRNGSMRFYLKYTFQKLHSQLFLKNILYELLYA